MRFRSRRLADKVAPWCRRAIAMELSEPGEASWWRRVSGGSPERTTEWRRPRLGTGWPVGPGLENGRSGREVARLDRRLARPSWPRTSRRGTMQAGRRREITGGMVSTGRWRTRGEVRVASATGLPSAGCRWWSVSSGRRPGRVVWSTSFGTLVAQPLIVTTASGSKANAAATCSS